MKRLAGEISNQYDGLEIRAKYSGRQFVIDGKTSYFVTEVKKVDH